MTCSMTDRTEMKKDAIRNARRDDMAWHWGNSTVILNMTSVFAVIQDMSSLSFTFRSVLSVSSREDGHRMRHAIVVGCEMFT
jgi:hypothetical protein